MKLLTRKAYGIIIDWNEVDENLKLLDQFDHKHLRITAHQDLGISISKAHISFMMYEETNNKYTIERQKLWKTES